MNGFDAEFMNVLSEAGHRSMIILASQPLIWIMLLTMMERRKGCWIPFVWMPFQSLLTRVLIEVFLRTYYSDAKWFWPLALAVRIGTFVICLLLFCYMFNSSVIKVMVANFIAEVIGATISLVAVMLINYLQTSNQVLDFEDGLERMDLGIIPVEVVIFCIMYIPLRPLLKKIRAYEPRHNKIWAVVSVVYVLSANVGFGTTLAYKRYYLWCMIWITIVFAVVAMYYLRYEKGVRIERDFLRAKQELLESHYTAVQMQTCRMEAVRADAQTQVYEIIKEKEEAARNSRINKYLESMREEYNNLAGNYCDDWLLDAFLYCEAEVLKRYGISLECRLHGYNRGEIQEKDLMQMLHRLLKVTIQSDEQGVPQIVLSMSTVRDQLLINLNYIGVKLPDAGKVKLKKHIEKYDGKIEAEKEEIVIVLRRIR